MTSTTLYRWTAAALCLGAVLTVAGFIVHPAAEPVAMTTAQWVLSHGLLWAGAVAAVAGLGGLYVRQWKQLGAAGAAGAVLAAVGLCALSGAYFYEAAVVPALAADAPAVMKTFPGAGTWGTYLAAVAASGMLVTAGFVLLGAAMYRAAVLPRWAILLATMGAAAAGMQFLLPRPAAVLAFSALGAGLTGLGYGLWVVAATPPPRLAASRTG